MNMRRKTPISVCDLMICTLERCKYYYEKCDIEKWPYDGRRDFLVDGYSEGIAVKLGLYNERDKGARRNMKLTLVDMTSRCEIASERLKVNFRSDDVCQWTVVAFTTGSTDLVGGHTYKLIVTDLTSDMVLSDTMFRLLDQNTLGDPEEWYEVISGGVKQQWETETYKVMNTVSSYEYYVRFKLSPSLWTKFPSVYPELELRLYYPGGENITTDFKEPIFMGIKNFEDNTLTVDFPFNTINGAGIFYAELRCMERPIAGFVFDTKSAEMPGEWVGEELLPMYKYSPSAASQRLKMFLKSEDSETDLDREFERLLNDFIGYKPDDDEESEPDEGNESYPDEDEESGFDEDADTTSDTDEDEVSIQNDNEDDTSVTDSAVDDTGDNVDTAEEEPAETFTAALDHLTGLRNVKEKLTVYENLVKFNKKREDSGLPVSPTPLHAMFLGSPGTGKTTVVKLMGQMLHRAGVLSKGHVVVRERATLLGQFYHSEAEKTLEAIEAAEGGILFIDEAYQLYQPHDARDPGKFVIETLLTALSDDSKRDWMLVLAGYPDEMWQMFNMNPGFKSRIPDSNIYVFDDFTEVELMEIAENYFARNNYLLTAEAHTALAARLNADYERREKNFGNARHVMNLIQTEILPSMAGRVMNAGLDDKLSLSEVHASDIPSPTPATVSSRNRVGFLR